MERLTAPTEELLSTSIEQYRELVIHAEKLMALLDRCDYSRIPSHTEKLQQLQDIATSHDAKLLSLFNSDPSAWESNPLSRKRMKFIKAILKLNKQLIPKIQTTMAVASAELDELKGRKHALSGYTIPETTYHGTRGVG